MSAREAYRRAQVLDARVPGKARQIYVNDDICTTAILSNLRGLDQLDRIFTAATALSLCNTLPGQ